MKAPDFTTRMDGQTPETGHECGTRGLSAHPSEAGAPQERPSGSGVGMVGRWADDDDTSLLDLFQRATA